MKKMLLRKQSTVEVVLCNHLGVVVKVLGKTCPTLQLGGAKRKGSGGLETRSTGFAKV